MEGCYVGIEIGGTKIQAVLDEGGPEPRLLGSFLVEASKGAAGICNQIESALRSLPAGVRLEGVGVGFGGPVDWRTGRIRRSHQIEGWTGFDLAGWLAGLTGARVRVDNDGNIAALGEALAGAGRGRASVFYVTLGSGVGGGLAVEGKIFHGAVPGEAEIGHVRLDRQGTTVESRCSGWAVNRRLRDWETRHPGRPLSEWIRRFPNAESKSLTPGLEAGDADARCFLEEIAEDLAFGLSHVVHLMHPEVVVIGGGLALIGEPLRAAAAEALRGFVMEAFAPGPEVRLAELGQDVVPRGALLLARS